MVCGFTFDSGSGSSFLRRRTDDPTPTSFAFVAGGIEDLDLDFRGGGGDADGGFVEPCGRWDGGVEREATYDKEVREMGEEGLEEDGGSSGLMFWNFWFEDVDVDGGLSG